MPTRNVNLTEDQDSFVENMVRSGKQYWHTGSDEDWEMAEIALEKGKIRHGLFFLHLAMEKLIKAHVFRVTGDLPPKIHNLLTLMQRAKLPIDQKTGECLSE